MGQHFNREIDMSLKHDAKPLCPDIVTFASNEVWEYAAKTLRSTDYGAIKTMDVRDAVMGAFATVRHPPPKLAGPPEHKPEYFRTKPPRPLPSDPAGVRKLASEIADKGLEKVCLERSLHRRTRKPAVQQQRPAGAKPPPRSPVIP